MRILDGLGLIVGNKWITWSDGDLFEGIKEKLMNDLRIEKQNRGRTYFRIFTNKKLFDNPSDWYIIMFPEEHVVVHSKGDIRPLFGDGTPDENKTGFVDDDAVGIFVETTYPKGWGKIKPPPKRR